MGVTVLGTRISQFEVSPTWLRLGASDRMVLCSCPSPSFVLSHIFVLLMLRKRRRGRGKECRMKDSFCSLQNIRHVRREGEGFPRLPGARLADWIKKWFLYNDARECSLKGDSKCALHMMPCEDNTACWCDQQQNYNYSQINNDWTMKKVVWIKQVHMTNEYVSSLDSEVLLNIKMILRQKYPVIR